MADTLATLGFRAETGDLDRATKKLANVEQQGRKTEGASKALTASFASLAASVGLTVSAAAGLNKLVDVARNMDVLNAQLKTATGSAEGAADAFAQLEKFARETPYSLDQAVTGFTRLVNLGLTPSEKALRSYGNTASAMGKDLMQMVEAVSDATVGEFERLKEFGIKAKNEGDTITFRFRGITTTVKNSAEAIEGYLMGIGENEFGTAMMDRMNSLDGAMSNMADSWNGLFRSIASAGVGEEITGQVRAASAALDSMSDLISSGAVAAALDASGGRFDKWGEDIVRMLDLVSNAFARAGEYWHINVEKSVRLMTNAFTEMPQNIRAFIQIVTVELAALADKAPIYGKAILEAMNPFGDGTNPINQQLQAIEDARLSAISKILDERNESTEAYKAEMIAASDLLKAYKESQAARAAAVSTLGKFKAEAGQAKAEVKEVATEFERLVDVSKGIDSMFENGLFGDTKQMESQFDSLYEAAQNIGGAWTSAGSAIIDAFGSAADVMDDYMQRLAEITKQEEKAKAVKESSAAGSVKRADAELALLELQYQGQRANLSMLGKTAGAAASLFKEQSKERKALHAAEKAFAAVEIALALQKSGANALTAITSAFAAPFPMNFAAGAAMIAIMSGLGVFGGGGGGGYTAPTSGTGTVIGDSDAKSGSIANMQEEYKDIALDQLAELQGIRESMDALSNGIANLAVSLVRSGNIGGASVEGLGTTQNGSGFIAIAEKLGLSSILGDFGDNIIGSILGGLFGSVKKSVIDSGIKFDAQSIADILADGFEGYYYSVIETTKKKLFGLSKKKSTSTELSDLDAGILDEIGAIFGYLADSVSAAIDVLGVDTAKSIESFVVSLGSVSFKDMTGEEIQKELEAMFSQQGDLMALYVLPQIAEYQKMGEGALETLLRVSKEQAVFNDALDMIGQSLGGLSNLMRIDVAQSIITMMGGLEEFDSAVSAYFKEFFTETEQFDYLTKSLQEAFASLGLPMADTKEEFRSLVDSLDLTTEAGQKMFAALMELVPGLAEWIKLNEKNGGLTDAELEAERKRKEAAEASINSLKQLSSLFDTASFGMGISYSAAQSSLAKMVMDARGGNLPSFDDASAVINALKQGRTHESSVDMLREQAINNNRLKELGQYVDAQLTLEEKMLLGSDEQTRLLGSIDSSLKGREDRIYLPPEAPPVSGMTEYISEVKKQTQMIEKLAADTEENKYAIAAVAKTNATMATIAQRVELDGQDVRVVA